MSALTLAQQAIDDDPNNPAGFLAAAWASLGLDDVTQARDFFREAAQASDDDQRQSALRQAVRLTFLLEDPQSALKELGDSPDQLSPAEEAATDFDRAVYFSKAGDSTTAAECIRKTSYHDGRFCLMALTDPILSRDATVAETAAEQLRAIREVADSIAAEVHQAHARYRALCKEIEDLRLAEAVWKWRERRDKEWQNILQGESPELAYYGLNTLPRWQAAARNAHAFVDQDERALVERRAEKVLNDALAREVDKGWMVVRREKLRAAMHKFPKWWWEWQGEAKVREVGLDPSGKVISTRVHRERNRGSKEWEFHTSVGVLPLRELDSYGSPHYQPCQYCWCHESENQCNAGELVLFP